MNETFWVPVPYQFEELIDGEEELHAVESKWHHYIYYSVFYLGIVFLLRIYMKEKPAYNLQGVLVIWNFLMAFLSIFATVRMFPGYLHLVWDFSMAFSICDQHYGLQMQSSVFWAWAFTKLKLFEFGDTFFLVLRKRKLTFLHCYHHALTAIITEYAAASRLSIGHSFVVVNYIVHSFMYTYYVLTALKVKVPKVFSMFLTTLQILQMIYGALQCCLAFYYRSQKVKDCNFPLSPIVIVIAMYLSYLILFCDFFYRAYLTSCKTYKSD